MTDAPPKVPKRRNRHTEPHTAVNAPRPDPEPSAGEGFHRKAPIISVDTYNKMYAAWCERQTRQHVSDTCRVNLETAERYIEHGDPKRRLPAIRKRWERTQEAAQMAEDYSLIKARRDVQTVARAYLQRVAGRVAKLDPAELDANRIAQQLQTIQVVLERTLGAADATVQIQGEDRFRGWTADELMEFAKTGTAPDRARVSIGGAIAATRRKATE